VDFTNYRHATSFKAWLENFREAFTEGDFGDSDWEEIEKRFLVRVADLPETMEKGFSIPAWEGKESASEEAQAFVRSTANEIQAGVSPVINLLLKELMMAEIEIWCLKLASHKLDSPIDQA
jgi:hypothetical protein